MSLIWEQQLKSTAPVLGICNQTKIKTVMMPRNVWGMELLINVKLEKKPQQLLLSVVNTLLWVLAHMHPWGIHGDLMEVLMAFQRVQSLWEVLTSEEGVQRALGHLRFLLSSWTLQRISLLPMQDGEKLKDVNMSLLWGSRCSMRRRFCVPEEQSRLELCQQCLFQSEESNPSWKVWCMPHVAVKWPWEWSGCWKLPKGQHTAVGAGLAVAHCGWWWRGTPAVLVGSERGALVLLLTLEGNTSFDFHDFLLYGETVLSIVVTGEEVFL